MRWSFIALLLLVAAPAAAQESWLCVGEAAIGFLFDKTNKRWSASKYQPDKYEFRRVTDNDQGAKSKDKWALTINGENLPVTSCDKDFDGDVIFCGYFYFNKSNQRFQVMFIHGHSTEQSKFGKRDSYPFMEIGRCSLEPPKSRP